MQQLSPYLRPGERILWQGAPDPTVLFTRQDLYLVPFTLLWAGFAFTWEIAALTSGDPAFAAFGVPFVAIGLYIVFGRFYVKRRQQRQTVYAVTSERALITIGARTMQESVLRHEQLEVRKSRDLRHVTVLIGRGGGSQNFGNSGADFMSRGTSQFAMWDVSDVQGLLAALDEARGDRPESF